MTHPNLKEILAKLKKHLELIYGEQLISLMLFGSQARKDATPDSDIDVMIILDEEVDVPEENRRLSEFIAALCLEHDILLTHVWTDLQAWKTRQDPLLINVRREGIAV
ncbi:MAG: nucleotidyltransferase domain-containing protein [Cyanobacteria bacterium J06623_4]